MKKKLVIVATLLLVVILSISMLVGCTPNNPGEYLVKWLESDKLSMTGTFGGEEMTVIIDGNKAYTNMEGIETYVVLEDKYAERYTKIADKWTYEKVEDEESLKEAQDIFSKESRKQLIEELGLSTENIKDEFDKAFEKKDGAWYDKETGLVKIEISKGDMIVSMGKMLSLTYSLSGKVSIPSEAKDAKK